MYVVYKGSEDRFLIKKKNTQKYFFYIALSGTCTTKPICFLEKKKIVTLDSHAENELTLSLFFRGGGVHGKAYWLKVYTS